MSLYISDSLNQDSLYSSGIPPLWTPADINTESWFDASDISTITESSGLVSQIDDKSGNNRHMVQATAENQPTTGVRTLNGLNVLDFDAANDKLLATAYPLPASGDLMMIGVFQPEDVVDNSDSLWSMNAANDFQFSAGGVSGPDFLAELTVTNIGSGVTGDVAHNGPSVYGNVFDFAGASELLIFIDGIGNTNNPGTYTTQLSSPQEFRLMANRNDSRRIGGAMAEIVLTEDVSIATRQRIEGYLADKWGTEANLANGHPYQFGPPRAE